MMFVVFVLWCPDLRLPCGGVFDFCVLVSIVEFVSQPEVETNSVKLIESLKRQK